MITARRLLTLLTGAALVLWPVVIAAGVWLDCLKQLLPPLIALLALRLWLLRKNAGRALGALAAASCAAALILGAAAWLLEREQALLYYPVAVNALFLSVFAGSQLCGRPVIETLARLQDPQLPPYAVRYVRRLTWVWCGFFVMNGAAALYTVRSGDLKLWTLYNGLISYLLLGALFALEYAVRLWVRSRHERRS